MGNLLNLKQQDPLQTNLQAPLQTNLQTHLQYPLQQPQTPIEYYETIRELKKQNKSLMTINESLRNDIKTINTKLQELIDKSSHSSFQSDPSCPSSSSSQFHSFAQRIISETGKTQVSIPAIEEYVEKMISDPNININYLPDFVEKQLYRNIIKIVLNLLDHILNNSHITVFNHEIKFDLIPISDYNTNENVNQTK